MRDVEDEGHHRGEVAVGLRRLIVDELGDLDLLLGDLFHRELDGGVRLHDFCLVQLLLAGLVVPELGDLLSRHVLVLLFDVNVLLFHELLAHVLEHLLDLAELVEPGL